MKKFHQLNIKSKGGLDPFFLATNSVPERVFEKQISNAHEAFFDSERVETGASALTSHKLQVPSMLQEANNRGF